jgi:hypothetical protein
MVRQPWLKLIQHIVLRRGIDPLMSQGFLRFANIPELRAHQAPEVMRLDMAQANLIRIPLHRAPHIDAG